VVLRRLREERDRQQDQQTVHDSKLTATRTIRQY
jgi:hypothetical protein